MNTNQMNQPCSLSNSNPSTLSRTFSLKRLLRCSCAWVAILVIFTAIAIAQDSTPQQSAPTPAGNVQRTDGLIEMDVVQALDNSKSLKNESITAATIQGEVTLTGTVNSESARELAEMLTARVSGVSHVQNDLKVANTASNTQPVTQTEIQPDPEQMAQSQQPEPIPEPQVNTNEPPPPHVQLPPTDPAAADEGVATQTVIPAQPTPQQAAPVQQAQDQPQDQPQDQAPAQPQRPAYAQPYPTVPAPPQPNYPPQQPQQPQQPNPAYGAHAPDPPYDSTPLTLKQGAILEMRTNQSLDNKHAKSGTTFDLTVIRDVYVAGRLAVPKGAVVHGVVVESKNAGQLGGAPVLGLQLQSIDLGANNYSMVSDVFKVRGPNKAGYSFGNIIGGAGLGALIGSAVGRGPGAAIGAVAGAGTGTALSAATPGPHAWIPAEALVVFRLQAPLTVVPVTPQEAFRLAQDVMPGGPTLYARRPVGYYGPGYPYPYPAPAPFYHPYYVVGGYYYWR
jgi:hypothetical protein